jgi:hypothetical protein
MRLNYPRGVSDQATNLALKHEHDNVLELMAVTQAQSATIDDNMTAVQQQIAQLAAAVTALTPTSSSGGTGGGTGPTGGTPTAPGGGSGGTTGTRSGIGGQGTVQQAILAPLARSLTPQPAGVPYFQTAPSPSDPTAQDGALILVGPSTSTATLMRWDESTQSPPVLTAVGASGGAVAVTNAIPVTANADLVGFQNLQALSLATNALNTAGKTLYLRAGGSYTIQSGSPSMPLFEYRLSVGALVMVLTWQMAGGSTTAGSGTWDVTANVVIATPGTGTGTAVGSGTMVTTFAGGAAFVFSAAQSQGSVTTTGVVTVQSQIFFGAQPVSAPFNSATQDYLLAYVI